VCGAALQPTEGAGWIDLHRGVFYRRPIGKRETKKRKPPVPLPGPLLAHLRRWHRLGICQHYAVEWLGRPVAGVDKAFRNVVRDAGLGDDVTPHTLRHTAATWLMQQGTDPWEAAGYLGTTLETLDKTYGIIPITSAPRPRTSPGNTADSARTVMERTNANDLRRT
jgi:integrase